MPRDTQLDVTQYRCHCRKWVVRYCRSYQTRFGKAWSDQCLCGHDRRYPKFRKHQSASSRHRGGKSFHGPHCARRKALSHDSWIHKSGCSARACIRIVLKFMSGSRRVLVASKIYLWCCSSYHPGRALLHCTGGTQ